MYYRWNWKKKILAKGWYLSCYICRRKSFNVYPNTYSRQSSFLFRGNSRIQFNHVKANKQSKVDILMKLTKNLVVIASWLWTRTRYWISLCANIRIDTIPLPSLSHTFTFWWSFFNILVFLHEHNHYRKLASETTPFIVCGLVRLLSNQIAVFFD